MVHFLRNKDNQTIISCEVSSNDLHSSVDIEEYSNMLLEIPSNMRDFVRTISDLDQIRGSWWENQMYSGKWKSINEFVADEYKRVAKEYNLYYVTD